MHSRPIDVRGDANKIGEGVQDYFARRNDHPLIELDATGRAYKKLPMLQMIRSSLPMSLVPCISAGLLFASAVTDPIAAAPLAREKDQPTATTQIRAVLRAQQNAWNRGDIDGFMNGYAHSNSTTFVSEDSVRRGWETVRDRYKKKYSDRAKMGVLSFSNVEITPLSANAAVVLGRWHLKRVQDQPHGCFTLIFRKTIEGWRIVHDHTSAAPPPK
jgi:ketosteroid isomerase-like protein